MRRFSRFYTRQLGLLQESLVHTRFSLTEARVLYELAHRDQVTASALAADLDLDHGYLSRILRRFGEDGLLKKARAPRRRPPEPDHHHGERPQGVRAAQQGLARPGGRAARRLERGRAGARGRRDGDGESLLGDAARPQPIVLRPHRPGDMGWVTSAHGALYAQEYGWDISSRRWSRKITAEFIENFDARRERCWIAEIDGERVGSVFVVRKTDEIAKLRLLIVDPQGARARARQAAGRGMPALRQRRGLHVA